MKGASEGGRGSEEKGERGRLFTGDDEPRTNVQVVQCRHTWRVNFFVIETFYGHVIRSISVSRIGHFASH